MSAKKTLSMIILTILCLCFCAYGCDSDGDDDASTYTLSTVLPDPVPVFLDGHEGSIPFDLSTNPMTSEEANAFKGYILDRTTITLKLISDSTGVEYSISEGYMVEDSINGAGEYIITSSEDEATIHFWNEIDGNSLAPGADYTAYILILPNKHFTAETMIVGTQITTK